jgi:broad specificity phosphatase PhoE
MAGAFLDLLPERFTVYLARHAMPDRSRVDIPYTVPPGPELTPRGMDEAAELGKYLCAAGVCFVQASPFERTLRTAMIALLGYHGAGAPPLEINDDLMEWRNDEIEKTVAERMRRAFLDAARQSARRGAPVAVVTHGGPVLALLKDLGVPADAVDRCRIYDHRNPLPTAGAWRVERMGDGLGIELAFVPREYHLPPDGAHRFFAPLSSRKTEIFSAD